MPRVFSNMGLPLAAVLLAALLLAAGASAARIVGTDAADRLLGTPRADTILGEGGGDRLAGGAGPDFLHGGPGRDLADAGPGDDRIAVQYDGSRDDVRCGPGRDLVNADPLDRTGPDCELVGRRLARDPYGDAEAQHETHAEPDTLTVGRTTVAAYQVGRQYAGGATNLGFSVSTDGGRTWRSGLLPGLTRASVPPGPHERASDPVVAYHAPSRTWLIAALALEGRVTRLTVSRSQDGRSWSLPLVAAEGTASQGIAFDKEWLACDNGAASPFRGRCYLVFTDARRGDALGVVVSGDGGVVWSEPAYVPVSGAVGAVPVPTPAGRLVIPFLWRGNRMAASVSADGGATFSPPAPIADVRARAVRGLRFFTLPAADVGPDGRVWVAWHDCRFRPGCAANDVVVASSLDGVSWSAPAEVTGGRNAMLPALALDPTSGRLAFAYHVVRPAGGIDVELLETRPGAGTRSSPRRLSAETMRPEWLPDTVSGRMLADYIGVTYTEGRPLVVWVLASRPQDGELRQAVFATRG
ncbi:MAG TPA: hypothetical protein VNJ46_09185 [Gaiellaceae bacterium]|nr:hypothetical protein [Gaiellaceae bacterium]